MTPPNTEITPSRHTPGPWRNRVMGSEGCRIFPDTGDKREDIKFIAMVNGRDVQTDMANGEFIVRAVNSFEDMLSALKELATSLRNMSQREADIFIVQAACDSLATKAEIAITKAEKQP